MQLLRQGQCADKKSFIGAMAYNRWDFAKNHYGITFGGGFLNNPGRYLTLLPPINGADAVTGSPYFTENPGDKLSRQRRHDYFRLDALSVYYFPCGGVTATPMFRTGRGEVELHLRAL